MGNQQKGEYFAAGVGAAMTGRGADLLIIDDPHSEQDALSSTAYDMTYEWYTSGPRQRLQPGGIDHYCADTVVKERFNGRLLADQGKDTLSDQWEVVEFPAIMPSGNPLWPEFWEKDELLSVKASLSPSKWNAQWQQNPTSEEVAMIKGIGGSHGRTRMSPVSTIFFNRMTQRSLKKKLLTTQRLQRGVYLIRTRMARNI